MKKLKKDLSNLLREQCSKLVYSTKHGDILIPESILNLNMELIQEIIGQSTDEDFIDVDDSDDIMDFFEQHLDVITLFEFHFDVGMGSSTNPLYLIDIEPDRKYLVYYFGVLGEYWLLGAITNYNKTLLETFFESALLRKESGNSMPFQFMHGAPTSYENYSKELIRDDFLNSIFVQLEKST